MNFNDIIEYIIDEYEGGYVNHSPDIDPGGETKYGISKRAFPGLDIKNLTKPQAKEIYRLHYWQKVRGEELPSCLRLAVLDFAIHSGVQRASRFLQKALGVKADGIIGPKTLRALETSPASVVLVKFMEQRLLFLTRLSNWIPNSKGWAKRILDVALLSAFNDENGQGKTLP